MKFEPKDPPRSFKVGAAGTVTMKVMLLAVAFTLPLSARSAPPSARRNSALTTFARFSPVTVNCCALSSAFSAPGVTPFAFGPPIVR